MAMKELVAVVILACTVVPCTAWTITVDDNGPADYRTIQEALDHSWQGDVIVVKSGTYEEGLVFKGRAVTVRSENPDDPGVVAATVEYGTTLNAAFRRNNVFAVSTNHALWPYSDWVPRPGVLSIVRLPPSNQNTVLSAGRASVMIVSDAPGGSTPVSKLLKVHSTVSPGPRVIARPEAGGGRIAKIPRIAVNAAIRADRSAA